MNLFDCDTIRSFLRSHINNLPKNGRGEVGRLAHHLGVSSTLVSQVLAGNKTFTIEQTYKLIEYLNLSEFEADYLLLLNQKERASTKDLENYWNKKLQAMKKDSQKLAKRLTCQIQISDYDKSIFYSSPLYSSVRLFCSTKSEGCTLEEICCRFNVSREAVGEVLAFMLGAGLITEKKSRYSLGPTQTHLEGSSVFAAQNHINWRLKTIEKSRRLQTEELMYSCAISLSKDDFQILREELTVFIKNFLRRVEHSPAEEVAFFSTDLYWLD